jgi:hypothetical protein
MKYYFLLQFRRLIRMISDYKINPFLGLIVGSLLFIWISDILFRKIIYPQYVYTGLSFLLIHSLDDQARNDFLKSIFLKKKYIRARLIENLIAAAPFFLFLLFKEKYLPAFTLLVLSSLLSFLNKVGKPAFVVPSPFSKRPFEFSIGFRRTFWLLIPVLAITAISIFYSNVNLGIFCLICLFLIIITYYSGQEPVFYVWIYAKSPRSFLKEKITTAMRYSFLSSLLIAVPLICFNPAQSFQVAVILIIGLLDVLLIVVAVYSNFPVKLNLLQNIQIAMAIFFPPLLLYVVPNLYAQAIRRLNPYLKC